MRNLAVITARSGSKNLKDKNIKLLKGKPLMAYSIDAAIQSEMFDDILVSTDSQRYVDIALQWGASVPFLRPQELAIDTASPYDAIRHALQYYHKKGEIFNTVAILQPTSPLRSADDIIQGYQVMKSKNADAVVAVCEVDHSPLWNNTLPDDHCLYHFLHQDIKNKQRQSLPTYYRINGALYIAKPEILEETDDIYTEKCYAYIMPRERSIDIDSELDFLIAEKLLEIYGNY